MFQRLLLLDAEDACGDIADSAAATAAAAAASEDGEEDDAASIISSHLSIDDFDDLDADLDDNAAAAVGRTGSGAAAAASSSKLRNSKAAASSAASATVAAHVLPKLQELGLLVHYDALRSLWPQGYLPAFKPSERHSVKAQNAPDYAVLTARPFPAVVPYHLQQKKLLQQQELEPGQQQWQQQQQQRGLGPSGMPMGMAMHGPHMQPMGPPHFFAPGGLISCKLFPTSLFL
jgi:hypothetical protein